MKKYVIATLILLVSSTGFAANHYIRAGASGSNDGSDWTNACPGFSGVCAGSAMVRGDTYYVADGTYTGAVTLSKAVSGTSVITVKKATASDHGTETGWNSGYGDGEAEIAGQVSITTSYWTLDGQTGGGPGSWKTGYGFYVNRTGATDQTGISIGADYVTVRHVKIVGHGDDDAAYSQDGINSGNGNGPRTFSYIYIDNVGRTPMFNRAHNTVWEYMYIGRYESTSAQHSEIASFWITVAGCNDGGTPVNNTTFRWSVFTHSEGTGGLIVDWNGGQVYGNVFYKPTGGECSSAGNGLIGTWSNSCFTNVKVYNNSFIDMSCPTFTRSGILNVTGTGSEAVNNFWYNGNVSMYYIGSHSYNTLNNSTTESYTPGTGDESGTGNIYSGYLSDDFELAGPTTAGTSLSSPYNVDMYGNTRGADGLWDRGAVEYVSGWDTVPAAFAFTDITDVEPSTVIYSDSITVLGIDDNTSITSSGTGCFYQVNGTGDWLTTGGDNVYLNDTIALKTTSLPSASSPQQTSCTLTLGGSVSDTWYVTTIAIPNIPTLISPPEDDTDVSRPVAFSWSAITGAELYQIQIATDSAFTNIVIDVQTINTSYEATTLLPGMRYYWRVRALQ